MSDAALEDLAREIHALGKRSNSFPLGQAFSMRGTFRIYFNRHQAAPLVWCIAHDGFELAVIAVAIEVPVRTAYTPKAVPDDDGKPSAWIEATGVLCVAMNGYAVIVHQSPA